MLEVEFDYAMVLQEQSLAIIERHRSTYLVVYAQSQTLCNDVYPTQ